MRTLKQPTETEFMGMVSEFIQLANRQADRKWAITAISDAILAAAARYNVFMVASADNTQDLLAEEDKAVQAFLSQYRLALHQNFAEYYHKQASVYVDLHPKLTH